MRPRTWSVRGKNQKTVTKNCSECGKQMPVACKSCACGHMFKKAHTPEIKEKCSTSTSEQAESASPVMAKRRTERVKRDRPNYFNSLEYVTTIRRRRTTSATSKSSDTDDLGHKKRRGRPRQHSNRNKDEEGNGNTEEKDVFSSITAEKALQYSLILADVNNRYMGLNFKPS